MMKTVERKMIAVQERVSRLRRLAEKLTSFDDYRNDFDVFLTEVRDNYLLKA
jgi:hypothetical protein